MEETVNVCLAEDCRRATVAKGFCHMHYQRVRTHGHPVAIPLAGRPCRKCGSTEKWKNGRCGECRRAAEKRRRATPEAKAQRAAYQARVSQTPEYKAKRSAWSRQYRATPKGAAVRAAACRKYQYGISAEEQARILEGQNGLCAICGEAPKPAGRSLALDHDHTTGQVRGFLCHSCNLGIGGFRDRPSLLAAAIAYLKRHAPRLFK